MLAGARPGFIRLAAFSYDLNCPSQNAAVRRAVVTARCRALGYVRLPTHGDDRDQQPVLPGFRGAPAEFVGVENYQVLFDDPTFCKVARNNLLYALGTIPTSIALALGMALFVNGKLPGRGFVRMAYFTPTILPMVAAANIWMFFYAPQIGLFNKLLGALGFSGVNWLGDPSVALGSVIVMSVWKEAGFL